MTDLLEELKRQEGKLLNCVHCGFCLPACPTYTRLGDEADSPRGRLHFMRALVEERVDPDSPALHRHLDRCLGCRACESVCPSGVEYGRLLESAREVTTRSVAPPVLARLLPKLMASPRLLAFTTALARVLRDSGIPDVIAQRLSGEGSLGQLRLGLGMIAATRSPESLADARGAFPGPGVPLPPAPAGRLGAGARTGMLQGCVQKGLLGRVNRATRRTLMANGYEVVSVAEQGCCGALHAHSGDLTRARELARRNIIAFERMELDFLAVNAAGCGAAMKDYPHLLEDDSEFRDRAADLARKVRDVSELLGRPGLRRGSSLDLTVTYDAPCHLLHAQGVRDDPLTLLDAIPGLTRIPLPGAEECCGGAGIYGITHPELGGRISRDKIRAILDTGAGVVATGNPGCMMQIGAGLRMEGAPVDVAHPVELLDESYRRGGLYS